MSCETVLAVRNAGKGFAARSAGFAAMLGLLLGRKPAAELFWAARGISFEVRRGECLGIIGKNGAGKSTLLQLIAGIYEPTEGHIDVRGRIVSLLELGSGFRMEYTGRENIFIYASVIGMDEESIRQKIQSIADYADIGDALDKPLKTYSSGMLVRLAFAINIHMDADILIIDEALAVGDIFFVQKCMRTIREFIHTRTVLFVSHDVNAVKELCSRVLLLDHGKLVMDGNPKDVVDRYMSEEQGFSMCSANAPTRCLPTPSAGRAGLPGKGGALSRGAFEGAEKLAGPCSGFWGDGPDLRQEERNATGNGNRLLFANNLFCQRPHDFVEEVKLAGVALFDAEGHSITEIQGGEVVTLAFTYHFLADMDDAYAGFAVRDYKGQFLFSDTSFFLQRTAGIRCRAGRRYRVSYTFRMPLLLRGRFVVASAVSRGTPDDYRIVSWVDDAFLIDSVNPHDFHGLIGVPMLRMEMEEVENPEGGTC